MDKATMTIMQIAAKTINYLIIALDKHAHTKCLRLSWKWKEDMVTQAETFQDREMIPRI